jgi:hypothetical protein
VIICDSDRRFGLLDRPKGAGEVYTVSRNIETSIVVIVSANGASFSGLSCVVYSENSLQTCMQPS